MTKVSNNFKEFQNLSRGEKQKINRKIQIWKKNLIFFTLFLNFLNLTVVCMRRTCYSDIESFILAEINVFDCHLYVQSLLMARSDIARTSTDAREREEGWLVGRSPCPFINGNLLNQDSLNLSISRIIIMFFCGEN